MQGRTIFVFPIIVGVFVDIVGTLLVGGGVALFLAFGMSDSGIVPTDPATYTFPIQLALSIVGTLFSIIGGYAAAHTANTRKVAHATIAGAVLGVIVLVRSLVAAESSLIPLNLILEIVGIPLVVLAAHIGGRWATQGAENEPSLFEWLSRATRTPAAAGYYAALVLLFAYALCVALFYTYEPACTVETVYIQGTMFTTSQAGGGTAALDLETYSAGTSKILDDLEKRKTVKAIIIDIDSGGGSPVAGEELASAIKRSSKPTVALIRSIGASSAYWAATGADTIFASSNSDVGGIGVQVNYLDSYKRNIEEGLNPNVITSAKFKTLGDPNLPLTQEERAIIQRDVDEVHKNFVAAVAENRGLTIEEVEELADGATVLGSMAVKNKLIDKVGGYADVKEYLHTLLGEEPKICESYYTSQPAPAE